MQKIIIYTDGSCIGNPGPGGWAWVAMRETPDGIEKIKEESGGDKKTTNNRMEMTALIKALFYTVECHAEAKIEIFSDSDLLVKTINQGWKKKANLDLWLEIDNLLPRVNFTIKWVKAHHNNIYNIYCDKLAFTAAEKYKNE